MALSSLTGFGANLNLPPMGEVSVQVNTAFEEKARKLELEKSIDVESHVRNYFSDAPVMVAIARCESQFRQYSDSGNVLRGRVNSQDVGVMQINERYHLNISEKLGHDIYTLEGNLRYARALYEKKGTSPWIYSKPCWSKQIAQS